MTDKPPIANESQKAEAKAWFETLRDQICAKFEALEDRVPLHPQIDGIPAGRFQRSSWKREDQVDPTSDSGGGVMAVMRGGRVFEKVGVNCSTVYGQFSEEFAASIPGAEQGNRNFWASGISLVAHPRSPHVPIAHMNTRLVVTSKSWFGGGGDLTPIFPIAQDTADFHHAFKQACDHHDAGYYDEFKAWCDKYFYLPHRDEMRGVGGIFYDYLNRQGWDQDFAFTKAVGGAFRDIYPEIIARHYDKAWTQADKQAQEHKRSRYVEFNLIYDRGTKFGLMTNGHTEAILVSMPPTASWH
ncbi:MAG: oxygen-dependent coproporphyrinogen oxidase [Alphaproteobacteria bacterium]